MATWLPPNEAQVVHKPCFSKKKEVLKTFLSLIDLMEIVSAVSLTPGRVSDEIPRATTDVYLFAPRNHHKFKAQVQRAAQMQVGVPFCRGALFPNYLNSWDS
ncbi:hypothetical protein DUNSADRAFT_16656 [Dunaliella salina]|uniref:Uncharacterized protein n=1 Tax=Dunaliella salina TaxID=3046 RepID=A0ABQ7G355_DUNSA|nr:hypothetical protein DUNSADRAFT_16656 [Dunaliella salina]|eukprot:KAF5829038.1 hypothetical protein DUNSADRAFT_16656 [Dunaliella salina]